jgi:putative SOS response-associated peptidase YedK
MATSATITTEPNKLLAEKTADDRMPVIVKRQDYEKWIEPGDEARPPIDLIRPFDSDKMKAWRVDRRINNVWNDEPSLIDPVKEDALPEEPKRTEKSTRKSKTDESGQMGMFD